MRTLLVVGLCVLLTACGLDSGDGQNPAGVSGGTGGVGGGDACGLPFEVGPCDAAIQVWAFVPSLGACFPHTWGGCGGNANRFGSLDECEAACPITGSCPPNRVMREICVACGVIGGCAETSTGCALVCGGAESCPDTSAGFTMCLDGVCQIGGCI